MRSIALATALSLVAAPVLAQDGVTFTLGLGAKYAPDYYGADSYGIGPTGRFSLQGFQIGGLSFGERVPGTEKLGFGLRGAFGIVKARTAADNPELTGLADIDTAVELGLGVGYEARNWRLFADLRRGVTGHSGTVGVVGGDLKYRPSERFSMTIGPRATFGNETFVGTYFGVTPAESVASGLTAFSPGGGLVSAGIELGMRYDLGNDWGLQGKLAVTRLQDEAARSPVTGLGNATSGTVSVLLTKKLTLDF
jgi:outer membrane protein